jgi:hypothetical protein
MKAQGVKLQLPKPNSIPVHITVEKVSDHALHIRIDGKLVSIAVRDIGVSSYPEIAISDDLVTHLVDKRGNFTEVKE